jgi:hypothetical protein
MSLVQDKVSRPSGEERRVVFQESRPKSTAVELAPFEDGTSDGRFRARNKEGKQYLLPKPFVELLLLLDGKRTVAEVAAIFANRVGVRLAPTDVGIVIERELVPRGLARYAAEPQETPIQRRRRKRFGTSLDFVLRFPLASPERIAPLAKPLALLFRAGMLAPCLLLILLVHGGFYSQALSYGDFFRTPEDMCLAYLLAFATVCIHELGHAAASRRFGCEHGEIGFCLYLIFPALYLDLSRSWGLPRYQRAVIDLGGIYFQLLTTVPLYLLYLLTAKAYFAGAIRLVDIMVLCAINPLLKFDGYWLLVDLSGLVNLQARSLALLKDCVLWPARRRIPATLRANLGLPRKLLLMTYSAVVGGGILASIVYMSVYVPNKFHDLIESVLYLPSVILHSPSKSMLDLLQLAGAVLFFIFLFRFAQMLLSGIITQRRRREVLGCGSARTSVSSQNI